jgi:hypothetical protein
MNTLINNPPLAIAAGVTLADYLIDRAHPHALRNALILGAVAYGIVWWLARQVNTANANLTGGF